VAALGSGAQWSCINCGNAPVGSQPEPDLVEVIAGNCIHNRIRVTRTCRFERRPKPRTLVP